jgi:N-acetyl-gamma-glutamyl-phosphate reductase/acetylglutamate kinase
VVQPKGAAMPLLHTLACTPTAMAEGMESALWRMLQTAHPKLAWAAPASAPLAAGAAAVQAKGTAHIPIAFPAQSYNRSLSHASGSQRLAGVATEAGPVTAMWSGIMEGSEVAAAVAAVTAFARDVTGTAGGTAATVKGAAQAAAAPAPAASNRRIRVGLLGARGYVGRELVRLIAGHPDMQVVCASSRALVGQDVLAGLGLGADAAPAVAPGLKMSDVGPDQLR